MSPPPVAVREQAREERFNRVWTQELNDVFADVGRATAVLCREGDAGVMQP